MIKRKDIKHQLIFLRVLRSVFSSCSLLRATRYLHKIVLFAISANVSKFTPYWPKCIGTPNLYRLTRKWLYNVSPPLCFARQKRWKYARRKRIKSLLVYAYSYSAQWNNAHFNRGVAMYRYNVCIRNKTCLSCMAINETDKTCSTQRNERASRRTLL